MERQSYEYQPRAVIEDYDHAVEVLSSKVRNRIVRDWPVIDAGTIDRICRGLQERAIPVRDLHADPAGCAEFMRLADYDRLHPTYYTGNRAEKLFEHYLACRMLGLQANDVFIDVASESGVLPEVVSRLYRARSYAQDIMYPRKIVDGRIGGDACEMPVPDGFASKAALTCSLEHFEGDADTRLFRGLSRTLAPGGKVFVVPLYMLPEASVMTDPVLSTAADVPFDPDAVVYCTKGWRNRHGRFYSPETLASRILTPNADAFAFTVYRILDTDPAIYARFALLGERI